MFFAGCGNVALEERGQQDSNLRATSAIGALEETPMGSFAVVSFSQSGVLGAANRLAGSDSAFEGLALLTLTRTSEGTLVVPGEAQAVVRIQHPTGGSTLLARSGSIGIRRNGSSVALDLELELSREGRDAGSASSVSFSASGVDVATAVIRESDAVPRGFREASDATKSWLVALREARASNTTR